MFLYGFFFKPVMKMFLTFSI